MTSGINGRTKAKKFQTLRAIHGDACWLCGADIDWTLPRDHEDAGTLDHVVPRSKGGTFANDNLRLAHRYCNFKRADRWVA